MKRNATKFRRAFRLAPVTASLAALAMVAACARTNGKANISTETQAKIAKVASSNVEGYDMYAPENMKLAARFGGASIVLTNRDTTSVDAKVKIVFTDKSQSDLIFAGQLPLGTALDANPNAFIPFVKDASTGADDQHFLVKGICANSDCLVIKVLMIEQAEDKSATVVATATVPAPNAPATDGDKGQQDMTLLATSPAGVALAAPVTAPAVDPAAVTPAATDIAVIPAPVTPVVPAPAAAPVDPAAAPVATTKKMIATGKNLLVFSITVQGEKSETEDAKVTRRNTMNLVGSGSLTPLSSTTGPLVSYEDAYQAKNGKAAPAEAANDDSDAAPADAPVVPAAADPAAPVAPAVVAPATTAPATTAPAAAAPKVKIAPAPVVAPATKTAAAPTKAVTPVAVAPAAKSTVTSTAASKATH